jgi:uncharacterized repeat protein (TIGR03806 family)
MHFGKDGYLYISLGDGEGDWDKFPVSQDTNTLDGSILRIDIDNGDPYSIPPDNPFFNGGGLPEIFAWGFRNPWRWSFDRLTGDIWVGDVGLARWEEINLVKPGLNYGWPIFEGFECLLGPCDTENFTFPIWTYFHDEGCAVIGGYVYRGTNISELFGVYLYSDICSGTVWGLFPDSTSGYNNKLLSNSGLNISSFAEDQNGEIYISDYYGGGIYKIVGHKPDSEIGPSIPSLLSKTGCFHTDNPKIPLTGLIPYVVNAPLWSDSAEKHRWMALPDDEKVRIGDDGKWIFPVGTVLVKNFLIDSKLIETRLLMQHQEEVWAGYSYEWNEEQTEAFLVDSLGKARQLSSGQTWWYPSRSQCLRCHTKAAGRVLGLETAQMNRLFKYPETDIPANQIRTLSFIGVLDQEFTAEEIKALPSFPLQDGIFPPEDQIAENARVYLHVNCSMCHRPKGPGVGPEDFRYETPLYQMGACDIDPTVSNLGIADAKLLFPGEPEKSIIWHRMNSIDENRMPPLATSIIDQYGVNLIGEWISSMDDCLGP